MAEMLKAAKTLCVDILAASAAFEGGHKRKGGLKMLIRNGGKAEDGHLGIVGHLGALA
jgi:hypothetical protein